MVHLKVCVIILSWLLQFRCSYGIDLKINQSVVDVVSVSFSSIDEDLLTKLLTGYKVQSRPAISNKKPVLVDFDMKLEKLDKLDIKDQILVANTRIAIRWYDPRLTWKRSEHNGTDTLHIPNSLVWTPDILLHNTAVQNTQGKTDVFKAGLNVRYNGEINWMSSVMVLASCSLDIKWFPFDKQTCVLSFGSMSYTKEKLQLVFMKKPFALADMKSAVYFNSGDWVMTSMSSEIVDKKYECCVNDFSVIEYTLKWQRRSIYWLLYLVVPCLCITWISLFTFLLPPESGERSGFGITTVLAMSVYLLVISDKLPEKSDRSPVIGVLYVAQFFLLVCVLLCGIITINFSYKRTRPPVYLRRLLKRKRHARNSRALAPSEAPTAFRDNESCVIDIDALEGKKMNHNHGEVLQMTPTKRRQSFMKKGSTSNSNTDEDEHEEDKWQEEWQSIAKKLDAKLFWVFFALSVIVPSIVLIVFELTA
eukprot:gene9233-10206_t